MLIPNSIQEVTLKAAREKVKNLFLEIMEIRDFVEETFPDYVSENEDWLSDLLNDTEFSEPELQDPPVISPEEIDQPVNLVQKKQLPPMRKAAAKNPAKKMRKAKRISPKGKSSGFRGVSWASSYGKWRVRACVNGKKLELGFYDDELDAAENYDKKVYKLTKDVNRLNFPENYV
jgi:hypothetical protein